MMEKFAHSKGRQHKHSTLPLLHTLLLVVGALFLSSSSSSSISSTWLPLVGVNALTYDNDLVNDPNEVATRHTRTKRKTRVASIDDLSLGDMEAEQAAQQVLEHIGVNVKNRLTKMFEKTKTQECRAKIAEHFGYFINAIGLERSLPFQDVSFKNECPTPPAFDFNNPTPGLHLGQIQNKTYRPVVAEDENDDNNATSTTFYKRPQDLTFCYAIMTHQHPEETIRLIQALYEPGHVFIVHVDAKESSDDTHAALKDYAASHSHVHILDYPFRVRVNWGGFSMVNATLQMLHYSFEHNLPYDKFIHLASTNYPMASNAKIRQTIAQFPVDANLMHIVLKPSRPTQASWHYFIECDDAVHRIYRLPPLLTNATAGVELYTSSQWFTLSREFAHYLAYPQPNTFVYEFLQYAQHVVVADETFFGTTLLHSPYCDKHHNWNYVHLQFDQWENQVALEKRDPKKCIMPDPNHCGRSPTTISMDYVDLLILSDDLFARKFIDQAHPRVKDVLDQHRQAQQQLYDDMKDTYTTDHVVALPNQVNTTFEGHGVLIVAKSTVKSAMPLCLGLGPTGNYAKLVPCFYDGIPATLVEGWETGAVILEETPLHNRWQLGPCTTDGNLERQFSAEMQMTPGSYSPTGPRCMLTQVDGIRVGRCLDGHSNDIEPGGKLRVFPCVKRWPQFFSFGNGTFAPKGSMHTNVPQHIVDRIRESRPGEPPQEAYLCLGVLGRGDKDEEHLYYTDDNKEEEGVADDEEELVEEYEEDQFGSDGFLKLDHFQDKEIVATQCSNVGAIIDWLFVPFIEEDGDAEIVGTTHGVDNEDESIDESSTTNTPQPPTCSTESCYEREHPPSTPMTENENPEVSSSR